MLKYIVYDDKETGLEVPVIFIEFEQHASMAMKLGVVPISAGFITMNYANEICCGGDSFTLKVKSRGEEDATLITKYLVAR